MLVLILVPLWLLLWAGVSVLVCPLLGFESGHHAVWCALIMIGGGGIVLPAAGIILLVWFKNRRRGHA